MSLSASFLRGVLSALGVALLALVLTQGTGCSLLQAVNPQTHLADEVYQLNDEARWARVDLASLRCDPNYRSAFIASHRRWGNDIRVADADVTNLTMGNDGMATSLVTYQWIDERSLELYATTVRQTWTGNGEIGFHLLHEDILGGEARLYEEVEGGPRVLDGMESMSATVDEGGMTTGEESPGIETDGPTNVTRSEGAPVTSAPVRRDSQGVAIH